MTAIVSAKRGRKIDGVDPSSDLKKSRAENGRNQTLYSISYGLKWQPCQRPFQFDEGIRLNFNYWMTNAALTSGFHVGKMIADLLNGKPPKMLNMDSKYCLSKGKQVIFVAAHGMDPYSLALGLESNSQDSLTFLPNCSCMPVRHDTIKGEQSMALDSQWRYMDVESMVAQILWPERQSLPLHYLEAITFADLFSFCTVIFKVSLAVQCITRDYELDRISATDKKYYASRSRDPKGKMN